MSRTRRGAALVALVACAACGTGSVAPASAPPVAAAPSPSASPTGPPPDGALVTSQQVLPGEAAYGFADIATSMSDAARAWERFRLSGAPPEVADGTALLFRGLGESGSCPKEFAGLEVEGDEVSLADAPRADGGASSTRVCTSDYRPRTLVVAAPVEALPRGPFRFEGFFLTTTPQASAPPVPSVVDPWIPGDLQLQVRTEPSEVVAGRRVDVRLTSGRHVAWPGSWETLLDRWEGQRWLPAVGSAPQGDHPAATPATGRVPAGGTGPLASLDTAGLPPGEYRVSARVGLGDSEGSSGVQGLFRVTG